MNLTQLQTDPDAVKNGVWQEIDGAEFLIASNQNPKYLQYLNSLLRNLAPGKRGNYAAEAEITVKAMAAHILLDWRGKVEEDVQDGDGVKTVPIPCTPENKIRMLQCAPFRGWVVEKSTDIQAFQTEDLAADKAASKSGSGLEP